jgi:hypothetical protein
LLAVAAVVGSVLGVVGFLVINSQFHLPFAVGELGVWTEYGSLSFGGVGAVFGVVTGRVAYVRITNRRTHVPVPTENPPEDVAVPSRRNIRPLTWLYRA